MHVFEVDAQQALWLALRADARDILSKELVGLDAGKVGVFEQKVYDSIVQAQVVTAYHMRIYREFMAELCQAPLSMKQALLTDFDGKLKTFVKHCTSHISAFSKEAPAEAPHTTASQTLFRDVVRPQLLALEANVQSELPMCPKCKTKKYMSVIQIQTRSGDEGATQFPKCTNCNLIMTDHAFE